MKEKANYWIIVGLIFIVAVVMNITYYAFCYDKDIESTFAISFLLMFTLITGPCVYDPINEDRRESYNRHLGFHFGWNIASLVIYVFSMSSIVGCVIGFVYAVLIICSATKRISELNEWKRNK